jgi:hypothetical protein
MKTILMLFIVVIAANQIFSQSHNIINFSPFCTNHSDIFNLSNFSNKSDTAETDYFILSLGLFKNFGDRHNINEENPYKFNLGFHLFNEFNLHFGLISGIDINKSESNGTFLLLEAVPQIIVKTLDPRIFFGLGGVLGMVLGSQNDNTIVAGILFSFRIEKKISKSIKLSVDFKHPHYFQIKTNRWDFILNLGITL